MGEGGGTNRIIKHTSLITSLVYPSVYALTPSFERQSKHCGASLSEPLWWILVGYTVSCTRQTVVGGHNGTGNGNGTYYSYSKPSSIRTHRRQHCQCIMLSCCHNYCSYIVLYFSVVLARVKHARHCCHGYGTTYGCRVQLWSVLVLTAA